jgi:hypothetical protein
VIEARHVDPEIAAGAPRKRFGVARQLTASHVLASSETTPERVNRAVAWA